jgi:flagellin-like hook-associated protein FlgL
MGNNIVLSPGVRQNLLALQNTAALASITQNRLATGKKVNSALDNPLNFFTSQALQERAGDLNTLLDAIGQATQTLQAANQGITSLTTLVQSAKSIATQALQTTKGVVNYSNIIGSAVIPADTTRVLATQSIATSGAASTQSTFTLTAAGIAALQNGDTVAITLNGVTKTFTFDNTAPLAANGEFATQTDLVNAINHANGFGGAGAGVAVAANSTAPGGVTVTSYDVTHDFSHVVTAAGAFTASDAVDVAHALGDALTISDGTHTQTFYRVAANFQAASNTYTDMTSLQAAIAGSTLTTAGPVTSAVNGSGVTLTRLDGGILTFSGQTAVAAGYATVPSGTSYTGNYNATLAALTGDLTVQVGNNLVHTINFGTGNGQISTRSGLSAALTAFNDIAGSIDSAGRVNLVPSTTDDIAVGGSASVLATLGLSSGITTPTSTVITPNTTRQSLQSDFNNLLIQIDQLSRDASYNGINLIGGDSLKVLFNSDGTSSLTIGGVKLDAAGLGLSAVSGTGFQDNKVINVTLTKIEVSLTTLRSQASRLGSNLTTVQTRQDFTKNLITTLQSGADNLVLADTNEEGANLLALQTRQQLSTTALSLANQASQAVLRLFG